jgi:hypothetical protein
MRDYDQILKIELCGAGQRWMRSKVPVIDRGLNLALVRQKDSRDAHDQDRQCWGAADGQMNLEKD